MWDGTCRRCWLKLGLLTLMLAGCADDESRFLPAEQAARVGAGGCVVVVEVGSEAGDDYHRSCARGHI